MPNYCQYCASCIEGDIYYCTMHDFELTEKQIKRPTSCKDYFETEMGSIITGKRYQPHVKREPDKLTMNLFEMEEIT